MSDVSELGLTTTQVHEQLRRKYDNLVIEVQNLSGVIVKMHEVQQKAAKQLDAEIGDNVRLRAALQQIADHEPAVSHAHTWTHAYAINCLGELRGIARNALAPHG